MNLRKARNLLMVLALGGLPLGTVSNCDYSNGLGSFYYDHGGGGGYCGDHCGGYPGGVIVVEEEYYEEEYWVEDYYYDDCSFWDGCYWDGWWW